MWRVDITAKQTGKKREQRQLPSKEQAETYAENRWREIQSVGRQAFDLDSRARLDATHALAVLNGSGLTLTGAAKLALKHTTAPVARLLVTELRERFLAEPGRRKNKLVERRSRSMGDLRVRTKKFSDAHANLFADVVTPQTIKAWLAGMRHLSPTSRNNFRRAVHAQFAFGVREGYCTENPVAKVPAYSVQDSTPAILTMADAEHLIRKAAETQRELGLLPYITIALFAGLRRAELERLDWSAVKIDRKMVTVDGAIAKTGSIRNVRLTDNAIAWLQPFVGSVGPIAPLNFNKRFQTLRKLAGILDWRGNELRHSFASYFYDLTQDASLTSAQLGHQSGTRLLFEHYRSLVPLGEGEKYFAIQPVCISPVAAMPAHDAAG